MSAWVGVVQDPPLTQQSQSLVTATTGTAAAAPSSVITAVTTATPTVAKPDTSITAAAAGVSIAPSALSTVVPATPVLSSEIHPSTPAAAASTATATVASTPSLRLSDSKKALGSSVIPVGSCGGSEAVGRAASGASSIDWTQDQWRIDHEYVYLVLFSLMFLPCCLCRILYLCFSLSLSLVSSPLL